MTSFAPPVERDALIAGMTLVPALVSRNRSFALFQDPEVRRARVRAALLRGIVRQLSGAEGQVEAVEVVRAGATGPPGATVAANANNLTSLTSVCELRYRVPGIRMQRRTLLTDLEYSCVAYLVGRASASGLQADDEDRARIDAALRRLSAGLNLKIDPRPAF